MGSFTTWRDLYTELLNDLQSSAFRTMQSYTLAGRMITYRNLSELKTLIDWVEEKANQEEGYITSDVPTLKTKAEADVKTL